MTSLVLLRKLSSVHVDRSVLTKLRAQKEDLLQRRKTIGKSLKAVLRRQRQPCRLCLREGRHHIFAPDATSEIAADIQYALDLHVALQDDYPQHVCDSCLDSVRRAAEFKRNAHVTAWRLAQEKQIISEERKLTEVWDEEYGYGRGGDYCSSGGADESGSAPIQWKCKKCRKRFHTEEELSSHSKQQCRRRSARPAGEADSFVCEVCGKEFKTRFRLKRHCTVHSTELKYACDRCPYKARWPTALVHHMRVHNGEKPVQCPHCPARFVTPSNLASHKRRHFPPQFKCDTCQRAFTNKQGLDNHIVSQHSNVKAHDCNICGKSFSTRRLMRRHELKNHNCPKRRAGTMPVYLQLEQENSQHNHTGLG